MMKGRGYDCDTWKPLQDAATTMFQVLAAGGGWYTLLSLLLRHWYWYY